MDTVAPVYQRFVEHSASPKGGLRFAVSLIFRGGVSHRHSVRETNDIARYRVGSKFSIRKKRFTFFD